MSQLCRISYDQQLWRFHDGASCHQVDHLLVRCYGHLVSSLVSSLISNLALSPGDSCDPWSDPRTSDPRTSDLFGSGPYLTAQRILCRILGDLTSAYLI